MFIAIHLNIIDANKKLLKLERDILIYNICVYEGSIGAVSRKISRYNYSGNNDKTILSQVNVIARLYYSILFVENSKQHSPHYTIHSVRATLFVL